MKKESCWAAVGVARPSRSMASLFFFRLFTSPGGHMWQCRHSSPFRHPVGFQNQAQGRQFPLPCWSLPWLASFVSVAPVGSPGGSPGGSRGLADPSEYSRSDVDAAVEPCSEVSQSAFSLAFGDMQKLLKASWTAAVSSAVGFGVVKPSRMKADLAFFLVLSSSFGHKWQCMQSFPFWQEPGFQNHAQGLQVPSAWSVDP